MTEVQPVEIAMASLLHTKPYVEFQGVMMPTTPTGSSSTRDLPTASDKLEPLQRLLRREKSYWQHRASHLWREVAVRRILP